MNLVGKIFVVLILIMSVVFMAFAMAVYATHKNWREVVLLSPDLAASSGKIKGLKFSLEEAKVRNDELSKEYDKVKKDLDTEKTAKDQAVSKLENELNVLTEDRKKREQEYAQLVKSERAAVVAMEDTQKAAADYRKELEGLRVESLQAQKDRDAHFKKVVELQDQLQQLANDKVQLNNRLTTLAADLAKAKEVLQKLGHSANETNTLPKVDGIVKAVPGGGLVEISLGSDDGLKVGHKLEVYRITGGASKYVGRVEIVRVAADRSVCKIDPKLQVDNPMVGDRVATKIE